MEKFPYSKLFNPLLFYIDKDGNSIFRNYCLFANDGYLYEEIIQVKDAGKVLEYRIELDKKLKLFNIWVTIGLYLWFIHLPYSFWMLLLFELLWIVLVFGIRMFASKLYSQRLFETYGGYKTVDFNPNLPQEKKDLYKKNFFAKIIIYAVVISLMFLPAFVLLKTISVMANKKEPNLKHVETVTSIYTAIYPKTPLIYDINAVSKFKNGDFTQSADDYIKIFKMTGKKFTDKDYRRFANLLYLVRKAKGVQNAIDVFNEYSTSKSLNFEQELKMLWIKSIFSISAGNSEFVLQDYNELLDIYSGDKKKEFYILADKAYMLYLMKDYSGAINIYNSLIPYAQTNTKVFGTQLKSLFLERGFAKLEFGDNDGANADFVASKVSLDEIGNYEPVLRNIEFIVGDF